MVRKVLYVALAAAVLAFGLVGCNNIPSNYTVTQGLVNGPVTVFGKVVDQETSKGIANATVYVKVNGSWVSANTMSSTGATGAEDQIGNFTISNLPVNATLPMVVKGPASSAYLMMKTPLFTNGYDNEQNHLINQDLGLLPLEKGVPVSLRVFDEGGNAVSRSDSAALPIQYMAKKWLGGDAMSIEVMTATQDATDASKYTIVVPQTYDDTYDWDNNGIKELHLILPAQDTNGDGKYDYQTNMTALLYNGDYFSAQATQTTNLVLAKIDNTVAPVGLASNVRIAGDKDGVPANELSFIDAADTVTVIMNVPIELATSGSGNVEVTYTDNFIAAPTASAAVVRATTTPVLSLDNTVVTLPWPTGWTVTENETYTFDTDAVSVRAKGTDAADTVVDILGNGAFMITKTGAGSIGDAALAVTVDNFNFCTAGAAITTGETATCNLTAAADAPQLVFPEPVWGSVALITYSSGTTVVTNVYGNAFSLDGQGIDYLVKTTSTNSACNGTWTGYTCGAMATGAAYVMDISGTGGVPGTMPDNTTGLPSTLKLEINAYDADGNVFHTIADYPVQ